MGSSYGDYKEPVGTFRDPVDLDGDGLGDLVLPVNNLGTVIYYGSELSF
jgi:hypothetical protein